MKEHNLMNDLMTTHFRGLSHDDIEEILEERGLQVLIHYYVENLSLRQIGEILNLSVTRIRQIKVRATRKILYGLLCSKIMDEMQNKLRSKDNLIYALENELNTIKTNRNANLEILSVTMEEFLRRPNSDISARVISCIENEYEFVDGKYTRIRDMTLRQFLQNITINDLLKKRNFGRKSAKELCVELEKFGLQIGGS